MTESVLAGTRVLDLSMWLPGPFCSMILGDLGAEIIKVERRLVGDPSRVAYPFANDVSCHFLTLNRNKKSLAINLKRTEGRDIFLQLAATADVVLESFMPGHVSKLGIGYDQVKATNPRIIYCSLSGYGQDGPYAHRAGHDINYAALGGLLDMMQQSNAPAFTGIQIADLSGALYATIGILGALVHRSATGKGRYIDVSMLASLTSFLSPSAAALLCHLPATQSYKHLAGEAPCYNVYRTRDGRYMTLGALEPTFWVDFCKAIDREDLVGKQFPTESERERVISEVQQVFSERTQADWIAFLSEKNICCEPVQSLEEALKHPLTRHRGLVFYVEHPTAGRIGQIGLPYGQHSIGQHHDRTLPPPLLGQHTLEILGELGYSDGEITQLREKRIIATHDDTLPSAAFTRRGPVD